MSILILVTCILLVPKDFKNVNPVPGRRLFVVPVHTVGRYTLKFRGQSGLVEPFMDP